MPTVTALKLLLMRFVVAAAAAATKTGAVFQAGLRPHRRVALGRLRAILIADILLFSNDTMPLPNATGKENAQTNQSVNREDAAVQALKRVIRLPNRMVVCQFDIS